MTAGLSGRPVVWAALFAASISLPATADILRVTGPDGAVIVQQNVAEGDEWCLSWNHSVTGGAVQDCFVDRHGKMTLDRSYLHDFAAGLGEVAGRGHIASAQGGGYWITAIDEAIPDNALTLRVGQARVDHKLAVGTEIHKLSQLAEGQRVVLRLIQTP